MSFKTSIFNILETWLFPSNSNLSNQSPSSQSSNVPSSPENTEILENYDYFQIVDDDKLKLQDTDDEIQFNSKTRDVIFISCIFMVLHICSYWFWGVYNSCKNCSFISISFSESNLQLKRMPQLIKKM